MKDPDFLAEAERLKFEITPVSGEKVDALVKEIYQTPKDVIATAAKAIK
jgi:hypothetical protein